MNATTFKSKIVQVGNSAGVRLPQTMLADQGLSIGSEVTLQSDQNGLHIMRTEENYQEAVAIGRAFAARYAHTLKRLGE